MEYFITEKSFKELSPTTRNVESKAIVPFIKAVTEMNVHPMLGTYFYRYLLDKYNLVPTTLTDDEKVIVDYIKPIIVWRVTSELSLSLTYGLFNKGIQTQSGDNSESVEKDEVAFIMKHYRQNAEWYENQLQKYLLKNKDLYPEFTSDLNKNSTIKSNIPTDRFGSDMDFI
jgi:hypothetical protein